jgi:hypothetical protein
MFRSGFREKAANFPANFFLQVCLKNGGGLPTRRYAAAGWIPF